MKTVKHFVPEDKGSWPATWAAILAWLLAEPQAQSAERSSPCFDQPEHILSIFFFHFQNLPLPSRLKKAEGGGQLGRPGGRPLAWKLFSGTFAGSPSNAGQGEAPGGGAV